MTAEMVISIFNELPTEEKVRFKQLMPRINDEVRAKRIRKKALEREARRQMLIKKLNLKKPNL